MGLKKAEMWAIYLVGCLVDVLEPLSATKTVALKVALWGAKWVVELVSVRAAQRVAMKVVLMGVESVVCLVVC